MVLDTLLKLVEDYDVARVADYYQLVGRTGSWTDNEWGWTNLSDSRVRRIPEGYILELPRPVSLK